MKTKNLKKLTNLFFNLILVCSLVLGTCFGLCSQVSSKLTALAAYKAQDHLSESAHKNYDFENSTGWLPSTNYKEETNPDNDSAKINAFAGSATGFSLAVDNLSTLLAGLSAPTTRFDGSPIWTTGENPSINPADNPDCDNFVLAMIAKNAPLSQDKVVDGKVVYEEKEVTDDDTGDTTIEQVPVQEKITYSFESSSTLSMTKNSYYALSFWLYTQGTASASVRISGDLSYETEVVSSAGTWTKYYIFLATHTTANDSIKIHLQYGNKDSIYTDTDNPTNITGYVLFDNLHIDTISETDYNQKTVNGVNVAEDEKDAQDNPVTVGAVFDYSPRVYLKDGEMGNIDANFQGDLDIHPFFEEQEGFSNSEDKYNLANSHNWFYYAPEKLKTNALGNYAIAYNADNKLFNASIVTESDEFKTKGTDESEIPAPSSFNADNKILKLENYSSVFNLGLVSKAFKVDQFGIYRVSIMLKATDKNAKATIMAYSEIATGNDDNTRFLGSNSVSAYVEGSDITNGWTEATLFIRGNALHDCMARLVILAEAGSTIYADNIKIEKVTTTAYSNNSSSNKLDLSPTSVLQATNISNGFFNFVDISNPEEFNYPLKPQSWTNNEDKTQYNKSNIVAGVIPTREDIYTNTIQSNLGGIANPNAGGLQKVNVLGIYAKYTADTISDSDGSTVKGTLSQLKDSLPSENKTLEYYFENSSTFNISSSNVVKITFDVFTGKTNDASSENTTTFSGNVVARLIQNSNVISDFIVSYEEGTGKWETYTIVIRTGASGKNFKLNLGISDAKGVVFFKNVKYTALTEKTVDDKKVSVNKQYDELLAENNTWELQKEHKIRFIDFLGESGTIHTTNPIDGKDNQYKSHNYTIDEKKDGDKVVTGSIFISHFGTKIDSTNYEDIKLNDNITLSNSQLANPNSKTDSVLIMYNGANQYSTATPLASATLAKESYFKLSVWVKTSTNVGDTFNIKFKNVDTTFTKIKTTSTENNGFEQYVALVKTGSSAISGVEIQFELGNASHRTTDYAFAIISDISIDTLTEDEYKAETKAVPEGAKNVSIKDYSVSNTSSNTNTTETNSDTQLVLFFVVFSSILLVIAMVIALVAVGIKKLPKSNAVVGKNQANVSTKPTGRKNNQGKDGFV